MDIHASPEVVEQALAISDAVRRATHRHAFQRAVGAFVQLLTTIPDYAPREFSSDAIAVLCSLAEGVITHIEERLSTGRDPERVKVDLAEAVYDIRRALEEIDTWHRHYVGEGP